MKMARLSKSQYTLYCQCAKALWLQVYKPEEAVIDDALKARFEAGNKVGDLAMGLLGPYEEVTTITDGHLDLNAMIQKTKQCIADGVENIAEASFSYDGNYCAVDILHKTLDGYEIYEVKSSTNDGQDEEYARDIAYQKFVLTNCGINVTGTFLVRINNRYVLDGELDIQGLFYITDMKEQVAQEYQVLEANVNNAHAILEMKDEPVRQLGCQCHDPHDCTFWQYCTRGIPSPSVFDLYRMPFNKKVEHYKNGIVTLEDARTIKLNDKQQMQVECYLENKDYINKEGIREFLTQLSYPLYFLDFETQQSVIPQYQGTKPYQQVPFQYSLHYIEHEGASLLHEEFLAEGEVDPRRAIAEKLVADIPMNACILAYNKSFECTLIKELAAMFPDLSEHLLNIASHIVDLIDPFRAGHYYRPAMNGSFSIKSVLPALFPDDPDLDYHNLEGDVKNGGDAMTIFPKIKDMSPEERIKARTSLLKYCALDTYAMVKVWEKLMEVSR